MPRSILTPQARWAFSGFPKEIEEPALARYFTLTLQDHQIIRRCRGDHNRLGFTCQIGWLRVHIQSQGWELPDENIFRNDGYSGAQLNGQEGGHVDLGVPDVPAYVHPLKGVFNVHWPNLVPADVQVKAGDMHILQRAADQDDHGVDDADAE